MGSAGHKRYDFSKPGEQEAFRQRAEAVKRMRGAFTEKMKGESPNHQLKHVVELVEGFFFDPEAFFWARRWKLRLVLKKVHGIGEATAVDLLSSADILFDTRIGYLTEEQASTFIYILKEALGDTVTWSSPYVLHAD